MNLGSVASAGGARIFHDEILFWSAYLTDGRAGPYRMYFYSHEPNEPPHIHVDRDDASAKFWLEPVALAVNLGFRPAELRWVQRLGADNRTLLLEKWNERFAS